MESKIPENERLALFRAADEFLKSRGYSIWGRKKEGVNAESYEQTRFEDKMQKGAYGRSSERGRK